ncbi:uncharacterized protein EI90DRAFT_2433601 [Cantharellus anzutake]|uniref:uncharacterized protein n=1 Tax=Cantharellus anzutake TaxID=1750568 RepID=UPI0019066203|nr:uncharacterized protein EI90DRAFT_2433601 [Cantharellus anzutake]KAF8338955.1 hypothetical protein EI90DRAFT_2433601 [Cantharellus anzutake]
MSLLIFCLLSLHVPSLYFLSSPDASDDPDSKCITVEAAPAGVPPHTNETQIVAKEVILCAGAISTLQILMVSGTGPDDVLLRAEIPRLVLDAEGFGIHVGRNLTDVYTPKI